MDSTLWNFRLRYILELGNEDSDSSWMDEVAVIESCLQLADAIDAHGRYSEVEEILTKIFSDKAGVWIAIFRRLKSDNGTISVPRYFIQDKHKVGRI